MRYADVKENDVVDCGEGICVSLWTQGCPHRCKGCHNPETWSFTGGKTIFTSTLISKIIKAIGANGIQRNFSVLGGEPLCPENARDVREICDAVKAAYPTIKIYVWTGYNYSDIKDELSDSMDILIDGPYVEEMRDITLPLRGSRNQRVIDLKATRESGKMILIPD